MATQVVMPKLSPTMEEGQLSRWLKKEGDTVSVGEPLAEIDTDKATMEAQALASGVLRKILVDEGATVPLGDIIAIIGDADEDISSLLGKAESGAAAAENKASIQEGVESGNYGAQQELAGIAVDGERTQKTIRGEALDGEAGGIKADAQPQPASAQHDVNAQVTTNATTPPTISDTQRPVPANDGNGATSPSPNKGRLIISPLAARMAAESNINLQTLTGSGPGGRIVKRDIETAITGAQQTQPPSRQEQTAATQQQTPELDSQPQVSPSTVTVQHNGSQGAATYRDVPNSEMRRTIARRLVTSTGPVPQFFLTTEIEMDAAADLRRELNKLDETLKISFNDIIIKVVATALMSHPQVNASYQDKTTRYYDAADIGVAVALEDGLITPVIRLANTKSIGAISREVRELAERARARRLKPEEYTGASFSVSNLGMFGIDDFTAIINPPEAAILAVGAVTPQAVVRDGEIVVRQMMRVTMSCDHRVVDGATGAKFLQTLKTILETPLRLLTA
jgi:pyruvate dehydrogenase E2 component (dihydrolipoamide acetyltransferase)